MFFREDSGKAWITFKERGQLGIHSHLVSEGESRTGQPFNISYDKDEFHLYKVTSKSIEISHVKSKDLKFKVIRPEKVFESIHHKNVR